eukprot:TRINITY_DN8963_c0_g1_i1.p1 TRINITY_DN8963_c0_g1~~TRINITY_DN8963_c0_g1_i1.p1  ORF type:complete len:291 (+),score=111.86 TRINITY_DN8963_c0_g1_i1:28-900(+)
MSETEQKVVEAKATALAGLGDVSLKKAETKDSSAPVIDKDAHVGENPLPKALAEVKAKPQLKKVNPEDVSDKSSPSIDASAKIGENPMKAVLAEVPAGQTIIAAKQVKKDLVAGVELKHTETAHDASAPVIDKDVKIKEAPQKAVFADLKKDEPAKLKHVDSVEKKDRSEPAIDPSVKIGENPMKAVLAEVPAGQTIIAAKKVKKDLVAGVTLKHTETEHDASAPVIEKDVKIGKNPLPGVLASLPKEGETKLKAAENVHDASAPVIDPETKIGKAPQAELFASIKKEDA